MKSLSRNFLLIAASFFGTAALAQQPTWFPHRTDLVNLHDANVSVGGTGLFTSSLTNQDNVPHQAETGSAGFLLTFRDHPARFINLEANYQYSAYTERFTQLKTQLVTNVPLSFHEFSAGYVFQARPDRFHPVRPLPFVVIGGGALYFDPSSHTQTQIRPTGLVELGADFASFNTHVTYRLGGRALPYRAPNFNNADIANSAWHITIEPAISVALHY